PLFILPSSVEPRPSSLHDRRLAIRLPTILAINDVVVVVIVIVIIIVVVHDDDEVAELVGEGLDGAGAVGGAAAAAACNVVVIVIIVVVVVIVVVVDDDDGTVLARVDGVAAGDGLGRIGLALRGEGGGQGDDEGKEDGGGLH
ncbi:hypothetical protein QBC34DRAFT_461195, partial [Podospora aff. communis PSN243]